MVTSGRNSDDAWGALAQLEEDGRQQEMVERYTELGGLPETERVSRMLRMANAEYILPQHQLREFTASRIAAWLTLEPGMAREVSGSYDNVMRTLPGLQSSRWVDTANELARTRTDEEQARLVGLLPDVFLGRKPVKAKLKWWWPF